MCTLAGYVGEGAAAPILLEMGKRQEGLWSGFYSGLATLSAGTFHWDKVVGDMARLAGSVAGFPGTVGLVHSRTNSGGDREWAHPFVSGQGSFAVVAQGSYGLFADDAKRVRLGNRLLSAGRRFRSAVKREQKKYPVLQDGSCVHSTEVTVEAVEERCEGGEEPLEAIRRVMVEDPAEGVYVFMWRGKADRLFVGNVNQRLIIGRDDKGTYLATSALAFPESVDWRMEAPANTVAVITKEGATFERLGAASDMTVEEVLPARLDEAFVDFVRDHPGSMLADVVDHALAPLFPEGKLARRAMAGYQAMERLLGAGTVRAETRTIPGVNGEGTAFRTFLSVA